MDRLKKLTDFDVTTAVKQHIVTLNITVDDVLSMQMFETLTSLSYWLA